MGRPGGCMSTASSRKFSQPKRVRRFNFTYRVTLSERKMANRIRHFYSQRRKSVQAFCARKAMSVRIYCKSMFSCMEDVAGVVNTLFSQFYINQKEGVSHMSIDKLVNGVKTAGKTGLLVVVGAIAYADKSADAALMQINGAYTNGKGTYSVMNNPDLLPEHMGDINNMVEFTVPAGYNQGVTRATSDIEGEHWNAQILADKTVFMNGQYPSLHPGDSGTFGILSDRIEVANKLATAKALYGDQFNPTEVQVPIPEPVTAAYLCGAIAALAATYRKNEKQ